MTKRDVQRAILDHLRANDPSLAAQFAMLHDDQIAHLLFAPGDRLRLTQFGAVVMQRHFQSCSVVVPDGELEVARHLTALENAARMPYFVDHDQLVTYDHWLAFRLRMTEGRLSILMQLGKNLIAD